MNQPIQPYPSGQHFLLRQHDARARQFLPFVRTRLTDLQRSRLVNALSTASALDNDGPNDPHGEGGALAIMSGAALVACSLETSRTVKEFLNAEISLEIKTYDTSKRCSTKPGIYLSQTGTMGWQLNAGGPKLKSSSAEQISQADIWVPMSAVTTILLRKTGVSLANMVADYKAVNSNSARKNLIKSRLHPFATWCRRKFGQNVNFNCPV